MDRFDESFDQRQEGDYDVAVVGRHLAGGWLAAILARHGARVLLVDGPQTPGTRPGETTVPYTTAVLELLAERFDVPEIGAFAHFVDLPPAVRAASGVKRSLSFLHHQAGRVHDPKHTVQFNVPGEHNECHVYRPVVDEHACDLAARRGAHLITAATVTAAEPALDRVRLTLSNGTQVSVRYLVDASGTALTGDAGDDTDLALRSRVLTTYMTGVEDLGEVARPSSYRQATPWSAGTVHHLFPGGWVQVVTFANHPEGINPVCAVTLSVDRDSAAVLPHEPEELFRTVIARYPSIAAQFRRAVASRPWTAANTSRRPLHDTYGPRWIAVDRAVGVVEDFLSSDISVAAEVVHATAAALLRVLDGAEQAEEALAGVARFQHKLLAYNDRMLASARIASADFALFNAFSRVWLLWQILAHLSLKRACADAESEGSWAPVERFGDGALWFRTPEGLVPLLAWFFAQYEDVRRGVRTPAGTASAVFRRLARSRFVPPLYRFAAPSARFYKFTATRRIAMLLWVMTVAPKDFQRLLRRENVTGRRRPPAVAPAAERVAAPAEPR